MTVRRKSSIGAAIRQAALSAAALAMAALPLTSPRAQAQEASANASFKGKTLTIYVGAPVGGGYDVFGRLLSRHIGRHLPGQPAVVVSNMPGGSGVACANFMYAAAPKDGTALAILLQTMSDEQELGTEGIRFEVARFNWIGRITSNVEIAYVWHTAPVKTIEDAKTHQVILGAGGPGSFVYPLLLNEMIGTRFKLVRGYQGTQSHHLAMQRGEIDGTTSSVNTLKTTTNWFGSHEINVLVQYAPGRHAELPDVPAVAELVPKEEDKAVMAFLTRSSAIGRAFVAPPGIAPETVALLRAAFDATMRDPELIADIEKLKVGFDPLPGVALQRLVEQAGTLSAANRDRVKAARGAQ